MSLRDPYPLFAEPRPAAYCYACSWGTATEPAHGDLDYCPSVARPLTLEGTCMAEVGPALWRLSEASDADREGIARWLEGEASLMRYRAGMLPAVTR